MDTLITLLRQRYPASCVSMVEDHLDQTVIQLDQFTITITSQGIVEVTAPTHSHQRTEQLAIEIEPILSQVPAPSQDQIEP